MGFSVKATRREAPVRAVFHGRGGIGKSTIAAQAPSAIFVCSEDGLENIDAAAVEPYPTTFEEVLAALDYVATLEHETIVIDSLDWLEPLVWDFVVRSAKSSKIKAIEDFGYGKGYVAALDQWRVFLRKLSLLREKGMNILLIAHTVRKPFKNPIGEDYEHFTIKLHEKAAGLIVEWVDVVGYYDEDIVTEDTSGRNKAQTTGKRVLRCTPSPAYLAKTRFTMPSKIVIPRDAAWSTFMGAVKAGGPAAIEQLKADFETLVKELSNEDVEKSARAFLRERGVTVPSLTEAIGTLESYLDERKKAS